MLSKFFRDVRGHFAVFFALGAPVLIAAAGLAVDYTAWTRQQAKLQGIADATAIAAAREFYMANAEIGQVNAIANVFANAQLMGDTGNGAVSVNASVLNGVDGNGDQAAAIQVDVSQSRTGYFTAAISGSFKPLEATAVARVLGGGRLCVIGLDEDAGTTIETRQNAKVTATECAVYSNSTSPSGIDAGGSSEILAELICSAGGVYGGPSNFTPGPTTDCPQIEDPLSGRPAPAFGGCDHTNVVIKNSDDDDDDDEGGGTINLDPGVYCGGIKIQHGAVHFEAGIYIIRDGPLQITSNSSVTGGHVGFYLTGANAVLDFGSNSDIDFTAPKDGEMAGILFFEDRAAPPDRRHVIKSKKADNLLGTIYLSRGIFVVETNNKVAQDSAYTAIIANKIELSKKPNLYLNADYNATDVPVPDGIGPVGGNIYLER